MCQFLQLCVSDKLNTKCETCVYFGIISVLALCSGVDGVTLSVAFRLPQETDKIRYGHSHTQQMLQLQ